MKQYLPDGYANVRFLYDGPGLLNVEGSSLGVATSETDPNTIASEVADLWNDAIQQDGARLADSYTYIGTTVTLGDDDEVYGLGVATRSVGGTQGGASPPPNVSKMLRKRTGLLGRKYRGRMYLPAGLLFEVEITDAGLINSGVITGENASLEDFHAAMIVAGYTPALIHQYGTYVNSIGVTVTVAPLDPTPITAITADPLVSTQRRRLR